MAGAGAGIGAGMQIAGGIMQGIASWRQGQMAYKEASFNAGQLKIDAQIAMDNAYEEARLLREQGRFLQGKQRTGYAISGVRMEGTPLDVMANSAARVQLDNVKLQLKGLNEKAQLETQAKVTKIMGKEARRAGNIGAFTSVLGGIGGAAAMFA